MATPQNTPHPEPKPAPKPTPQDEAVNDGPPKLAKLSSTDEAMLVELAMAALGANREMVAVDPQGRLWTLAPDGEDGSMGLAVRCEHGDWVLGENKVPASQIQCAAGPALLRGVFAIAAGGTTAGGVLPAGVRRG